MFRPLIIPRQPDSAADAFCRRWGGMLAACWLLVSAASADEPDGLAATRAIERQFVDVIGRCEGAVVSIVKVRPDAQEQRRGFVPFPRERQADRAADLTSAPAAFGSGVIIANEVDAAARFVLTNYHVLQPDREGEASAARGPVVVRLANHRVARAVVIAADPRSDLAMLRLVLSGTGIDPADVAPIPLGDASDLRKGQIVLALGNPYAIGRDGSASASWGLISNISRRAAAEGDDAGESEPGGTIHQYGTLLHVDTRLSLGTSGGALVNLEGRLIGLTTSLAALEGYEKSVGYAIPIDAAMRRVIDSLLKGYEVEYGFLGILPRDVALDGLRGFPVATGQVSAARADFVSAGSPAARAGLRSDDVILQIDGQPVRSADDLMRDIGLLGPGTLARIDVWRQSRQKRLQIDVTLGKWPVWDDSQIVATQRRYPTWRGLDVDYPTARRRFLTSEVLERYHRAVLVLNVAGETASHAAGLRPGDLVTHVGNVAVETPQQFRNAVAGRSDTVTLTRLDGTRVAVSPPAEE